MAHRIRLAGFWENTPRPEGGVRIARKCGAPRTADPAEIVWLVGGPSPQPATLLLNDQALGPVHADRPFAFAVTGQLRPRNVIAFDAVANFEPLVIALEIRVPLSPPSDLFLIPAEPDDFDFAHDLTHNNMNEYVRLHWGEWNPAIFAANYAKAENMVLRIGDERIGYVRWFAVDDRLVIEDVQIVTAWQGRGVGGWVLAAAERQATVTGKKSLRLRCFAENPAYRLYLRAGFIAVEFGPDGDWLEKAVSS